MGKIVKRIVLTGGPSAGKSSSLDIIKNYLISKDYFVYIVNESATELIKSGIGPNINGLNLLTFQRYILKYQLFKEKIVEEVAFDNNNEKDIVIIYDRGVIDNKAYITENEFLDLLNEFNLNEKELINKYDLVIHLETGAKGKFYRTDNNCARCESIEEAIKRDARTYEVWSKHNNLVKVKCYEEFVDKQKEIIRICEENLNKKEVKRLKLV